MFPQSIFVCDLGINPAKAKEEVIGVAREEDTEAIGDSDRCGVIDVPGDVVGAVVEESVVKLSVFVEAVGTANVVEKKLGGVVLVFNPNWVEIELMVKKEGSADQSVALRGPDIHKFKLI